MEDILKKNERGQTTQIIYQNLDDQGKAIDCAFMTGQKPETRFLQETGFLDEFGRLRRWPTRRGQACLLWHQRAFTSHAE